MWKTQKNLNCGCSVQSLVSQIFCRVYFQVLPPRCSDCFSPGLRRNRVSLDYWRRVPTFGAATPTSGGLVMMVMMVMMVMVMDFVALIFLNIVTAMKLRQRTSYWNCDGDPKMPSLLRCVPLDSLSGVGGNCLECVRLFVGGTYGGGVIVTRQMVCVAVSVQICIYIYIYVYVYLYYSCLKSE